MEPDVNQSGLQFIKLTEVMSITGLSKSSIYAAVKAGAFPAQVKLSTRASAWVKGEVQDWVAKRIKEGRP